MKTSVIVLIATSIIFILNNFLFWATEQELFELLLGSEVGLFLSELVNLTYEAAFIAFVWLSYTRLRDSADQAQ